MPLQILEKLSTLFSLNKQVHKDYYVFENVFTEDEIDHLKEQMKLLEDDPISKKNRAQDSSGKKNKLFVIRKQTRLFQDLKTKITPILPFNKDSFDYFSMNFYHLQLPYGLHCDNLGDELGHYQIVIPLEFEEDKIPPSTILFDQTSPTYTEWISPVYNKPKDYKPFRNKPIFDPTYYPGWKNKYRISEKDGYKYWGKWWDLTYRDAYKGFSIKYAYQWKLGDLFLFNSQLNHCASILDDNNTSKTKDGILVCLQKPNHQ